MEHSSLNWTTFNLDNDFIVLLERYFFSNIVFFYEFQPYQPVYLTLIWQVPDRHVIFLYFCCSSDLLIGPNWGSVLWNTHTQTHTILSLTICIGESLVWILTPPWLLFSLRGWRKRCQHDPGSWLWRGSGGKSKTLSISSPHIDVLLSQIFCFVFPVKISHIQRHVERRAHRWFLFMRVYCLSRGNKDDRMLLCLSKSKSLSSALLLSWFTLWIPCLDG